MAGGVVFALSVHQWQRHSPGSGRNQQHRRYQRQKIELIERDDEAKNDIGAKIAQEFTEKKVVAAIGIVNTGVGLASIDAYQKAKIPLMVAVSTGTALTKKFAPPAAPENYIFRIAPTLDLEAKVLVAELKRSGLNSVAVLADTTARIESVRAANLAGGSGIDARGALMPQTFIQDIGSTGRVDYAYADDQRRGALLRLKSQSKTQ